MDVLSAVINVNIYSKTQIRIAWVLIYSIQWFVMAAIINYDEEYLTDYRPDVRILMAYFLTLYSAICETWRVHNHFRARNGVDLYSNESVCKYQPNDAHQWRDEI